MCRVRISLSASLSKAALSSLYAVWTFPLARLIIVPNVPEAAIQLSLYHHITPATYHAYIHTYTITTENH